MTPNPTPTTLRDLLDELCKHTQADYGYEKLVPIETNKTAHQIQEQLKALLPEKHDIELYKEKISNFNGREIYIAEKAGFNEAIDQIEKAIEEWAK